MNELTRSITVFDGLGDQFREEGCLTMVRPARDRPFRLQGDRSFIDLLCRSIADCADAQRISPNRTIFERV